MSKSTVGRNIKILKDAGVIRRKGSDKTGIWEILTDVEDVS
jgi:predicted HTH transcriptional regulator